MGSSETPDTFGGLIDWMPETESGGILLDVEGVGRVFESDGNEDLKFIGPPAETSE